MKPMSRRKLYIVNRLFLFFFVICESFGEMIIRESKVDPFSLLLNNQRQMLDKMDFIMAKLKTVDVMETKVSSLTFAVVSTNNKLDQTQQDIEILKEEVRNISKDIITIINNPLSQSYRHNLGKTNATRNPCYDLIDILKNGMRDIFKCNSILSFYQNKDDNEPYTEMYPREVINTTEFRDIGSYKEEEMNKTSVNDDIMTSEDENVLSQIELMISSKVNRTYNQLTRVLSLLHNVEYRQHVSSIAQDRRLNTLLHKMAVHQTVLEERIIESLRRGFKDTRQDLEGKLQTLENHLNNEEKNFNSLRTHLTFTLRNLTLLRTANNNNNSLDYSIICSDNSKNCSHCGETDEYSTDHVDSLPSSSSSSLLPNDKNVSGPSQPPSRNDLHPEVSNSSSFRTNGSITINNEPIVATGRNSPKLLDINFPFSVQHFNNDNDTKKHLNYKMNQPNPNLNEVNAHHPRDVFGTEKIVVSEEETRTDETIEYLSKFINEQITNIENVVNKRMTETEDKLIGLRIHQSSSLYSHTKEIRYEMEKLERGISETIHTIGNKIAKKLEGARKALFAFIDAAVTSVSSAAVTSAQSTGIQVAKELRETMKDIGEKIAESNIIKKELAGCPQMYQRVGRKCFLVLNNIGTTWKEGCRLCKVLGGDLAYIPRRSDILTLKEVLRLRPSEELWIRNPGNPTEEMSCDIRSEEQEEELTNSVATTDSKTDFNKYGNETDLNCNTLCAENYELKTAPCVKNLGVLCQYQISNYSVSESLPVNTSEPLVYDDVIENISYRKNKYF